LAGGPSQTRFETLYKFAGIPDGETPQGLVAGPNGVLYGTTSYGGAFGYGSVFELRPPAAPDGKWTETVIYSFAGSSSDGAFPYASPIVGANGAIYGTTAFGGYTGSGTVFELIPPASPGGAWTETVLFTFYAGGDNGGTGYDVYRGLVAGSNGELYGVASEGGLFYFGTAFELTPPTAPGGTWTFSLIYSFTGDGREPAGLTISADGVLYGTTSYGGSAGAGTVFELTPPTAPGGAWTGGTIYAFTGGADGDAPLQPPVIANDGTLYGTTSAGGGSASGTVFELRPPATPDGAWTETVLYDLSSSGDGKIPDSPLIVRKGVIYGTTAAGSGSKSAGGTVFQLRRPGTGGPWTETVLHGFAGTAGPAGSLVMDESGAIYGTTTSGPGPNGAGTAYGINP
jgi:uncharacterized repeat protein (TIGR03803 family)